MFFRNNNIDDDSDFKISKKNVDKEISLSSFKLPLIILGIIFVLLIICLLYVGIFNKEEVVYEEKLYYITLVGDDDITLYLGEEYIEPGYSGMDDNRNDVTKDIVVTSNVDMDKVGTYKVSYTLENITKERNIKVIEKPVGATKIHLYGAANVFLYVGEKYEEKGYEVVDTIEGAKLREQVKVNSNVDTAKPGIYKVTYTVTNKSGITTTAIRNVIVMDSEMSVFLANDSYTNDNVKINIYINDELFDYLLLPNNEKVTQKIYTYVVSDNGTYKFVMYNQKDRKIEKSISVNNINKTLPSGSCSGSYKDGISTININAKDDIGIARYEIDGNSYTTNQITINKEMKSVDISIYDKANNKADISCNLEDKNKEKIEAGNFKFTDGPMPYYVYIPPEATTGMPMLVWLHGDHPREEWVRSERLGKVGYESGNSFILVKPYAGRDLGSNGNPGWYEGGLLPKVKQIADIACEKYKCDKTNINIGGHSRGAIGTWNIVSMYPGYFHAAAPISCCAFYNWDPSNYKEVKVWAIRGSGAGTGSNNDDIYGPCMESNVNSVKKYAKEVRYTILPNTTHGEATDNLDGEFFHFLISD